MSDYNYGFINPVHEGLQPPTNTKQIWIYNLNPDNPIFRKYYNGEWVDFANSVGGNFVSTDIVPVSIGGFIAGQPATSPEGLNLQQFAEKLVFPSLSANIVSFVASPSSLQFNQQSTQLSLSWVAQPRGPGVSISSYKIERQIGVSGNWTQIYLGTANSTNIEQSNLQNQVNNYRLTVATSNGMFAYQTISVGYSNYQPIIFTGSINSNNQDFLSEIGASSFNLQANLISLNAQAPIQTVRLFRKVNSGQFVQINSQSVNGQTLNFSFADTVSGFNQSLNYKIEIDDASGTSTFNFPSCVFASKIYIGGTSSVSNLNENQIKALNLSAPLSLSLPSEFNFLASATRKVFAYPSAFNPKPNGYKQNSSQGINVAMSERYMVSVTNQFGYTQNYTVDSTTNVINGAIKILPNYN